MIISSIYSFFLYRFIRRFQPTLDIICHLVMLSELGKKMKQKRVEFVISFNSNWTLVKHRLWLFLNRYKIKCGTFSKRMRCDVLGFFLKMFHHFFTFTYLSAGFLDSSFNNSQLNIIYIDTFHEIRAIRCCLISFVRVLMKNIRCFHFVYLAVQWNYSDFRE